MKNVQNNQRANSGSLPFFFKSSFKVSFVIIFISSILLFATFFFDTVPPILNRGIQPATFPKGLLILIIFLTLVIYLLSLKNPWKKEKKLPNTFFKTLYSFILFVIIAKTLDFFFSNFSTFATCFSLLGGKKNFLFIISECYFPSYCFHFF